MRGGNISNSSKTILASEWDGNWSVVAATGDIDNNAIVCKSHRSVSGFYNPVGGGGWNNLYEAAPNKPLLRIAPGQVDIGPKSGPVTYSINGLGRNHGTGQIKNKKTNFLYVDGHVESKLVEETVDPSDFQWGEKCWSLAPGDVYMP